MTQSQLEQAGATIEPRPSVVTMVEEVIARISEGPPEPWIYVAPLERLREKAQALDALPPSEREALPLFGLPFAVKDNIDVAGMPTTAGCPDFSYLAHSDSTVVQKLRAAGAIPIGKTNLDQFATGLVGTRSPYGAVANAHASEWISGGSSSGSAVAVALEQVPFALGTDTAGSGRVPASLNRVVGLKPSRGLISTHGVVPACRSLDCVSILAEDCAMAERVFDTAIGFDALDPYSRPTSNLAESRIGPQFRFGTPSSDDLDFMGDQESEVLFAAAVNALIDAGGDHVEIDYAPFADAAALLYEGPFVAERVSAIGEFAKQHPESLDPTVRSIVEKARTISAHQVFPALEKLALLRRVLEPMWRTVDVVVVPTTATVYRIEDVQADPIALNANLGRYTNFMNLLDLCGLVVPTGSRESGVGFGPTLCAPAFREADLLELGRRLEGKPARTSARPQTDRIDLAVVGAHLQGEALNGEVMRCGGQLRKRCKTSSDYRLYRLPGGPPARPALRRDEENGHAIVVEVWSLPLDGFGEFVKGIPRPLAIGRLELDDGTEVAGFVCEPDGFTDATDISDFGGWQSYLASESNSGKT